MIDLKNLVGKESLLYVWQKIKSTFAKKTDLPTKTSELTNDSGYKTTDTTYDDVTTTTHGLMTAADKVKINSVESGAQVNPTGLSAFTNDGNYVVDASYVHTDNNLTAALVKKINDAGSSTFDGAYENLTGKPDLTVYQTAAQVNTAIDTKTATAVRYKGTVASSSALPTTGMVNGDMYNLEDTGMNTVWNGTTWDDQAPTIDLSGYVKTSDLSEITNAEIDTICV